MGLVTTLAAITATQVAAGAAVAATGLTAYGMYQSGKQAEKLADAQAQAAEAEAAEEKRRAERDAAAAKRLRDYEKELEQEELKAME